MKALAVLVSLATLALMATAASAQNLVMAPSKVLPAAVIHVALGTDNNGNTTVDLKAEHLAKPSSLNPPASVYVVWVQRDEQRPQLKGQLQVDDDLNAELKFVTPETRFQIIITAQQDASTPTPSGTEVARSSVARKK
jgi:hypothetical protein